ncbi:uncharacterized protein FA14DRAFT_174580 [Meira miltonrushii]|uniref:Macrofage activating glyco protein n=1 Tax=Meira miltonrushii TaxID=1280837 RepID=A0A316V6R5_9BASI|nr:uncharacterized protein FA14DRAFT_174580 [Meira miltonrushii]PWN32914.1 hypothetical protein FA14DRAFT_174580 [Meira miltonrushii]
MASILTWTLASLAISGSVLAQGDPEALVPGKAGQPTKAWTQWQPKPTYSLDELPDQYMGSNRVPSLPNGGEPQTGWNRCAAGKWNQKSLCQTAWINDVNDWCIWGPPDGGDIGTTERVAVAYCTTNKHGTRLIPDGTLTSVHFLKTPSYVQVSGTGDFTSIGIPMGDSGGEMDPHGADDLGNPIGGIMFTTANPASNGQPRQVREWTNFMSWDQYCLRACWGDQAAAHCEHIYDVMGCRWNMPSLSGYTAGIWESCEGEDAPLQGIYGGSTFRQGEAVTPDAHPPAASSDCVQQKSLGNGLYSISSTGPSAPTSTMPTSGSGSGSNRGGSTSGSSPTNGADRAASNNTSSATSIFQKPSLTAIASTFGVGALAALCYVL